MWENRQCNSTQTSYLKSSSNAVQVNRKNESDEFPIHNIHAEFEKTRDFQLANRVSDNLEMYKILCLMTEIKLTICTMKASFTCPCKAVQQSLVNFSSFF